MAPLFTYGILMNFNQENLKNITTNNKGTRASWDILEKGNKYHKGIHLANSSILHIRAL